MRRILKKSLPVLIGVLIGVSAVLGMNAVQRRSLPESRSLAPSERQPAGTPRSFSRTLTSEERAALETPAKDATDVEKRQHFELVQPLAKRAEWLDITGCLGDPVVFQVGQGEKFLIKNSDPVAYVIQLSAEQSYTVPAGGTKEVVADFGFGPGVYGYGCDNSTGARGILFVTPAGQSR